MVHNTQTIIDYLIGKGVFCITNNDGNEIITEHRLGHFDVKIRAELPDDFPCSLPSFHLVDRDKYGALAHVAWRDDGYADICYGIKESFSADFHHPENVFLAALDKALAILDKSLNDPAYNEAELISEFTGVWRFHAKSAQKLICIVEPKKELTELTIRSKVNVAKTELDGRIYAIDQKEESINRDHFLLKNALHNKRNNKGKGLLVPITPLLAPPPPNESIESWWGKQLSALSVETQRNLADYSRREKSREFFIVCCAELNSNSIFFGIQCHSIDSNKNNLPLTVESVTNWKLNAIELDTVSKELLIARCGGATNLNECSGCIVGCGSLGGHITDMLASYGIGKLTLVDFDVFKIENLHRHILSPENLFIKKTKGLKRELERKYPFLNVKTVESSISDITDREFWSNFGVIIIATGSPTHERKFNEFIRLNNIPPPVVYAWNEPYGVGGHAIASIADKKGCLACAYVNNETDEPDLYPNINFIHRDQNVMTRIGGCGSDFLSFSGIDSMQTAAMVTKLAIKCLRGKVSQGMSISWKGDAEMAENAGIELTHRYWRFSNNLKEVPLARTACSLCHE